MELHLWILPLRLLQITTGVAAVILDLLICRTDARVWWNYSNRSDYEKPNAYLSTSTTFLSAELIVFGVLSLFGISKVGKKAIWNLGLLIDGLAAASAVGAIVTLVFGAAAFNWWYDGLWAGAMACVSFSFITVIVAVGLTLWPWWKARRYAHAPPTYSADEQWGPQVEMGRSQRQSRVIVKSPPHTTPTPQPTGGNPTFAITGAHADNNLNYFSRPLSGAETAAGWSGVGSPTPTLAHNPSVLSKESAPSYQKI